MDPSLECSQRPKKTDRLLLDEVIHTSKEEALARCGGYGEAFGGMGHVS